MLPFERGRRTRTARGELHLAYEAAVEAKHEYVNGLLYAIAGGTVEHGRLAMRFGRVLGNALGHRPCEAFSFDVRVRVEASGRSAYPDLSVVCGQLRRASDDAEAIANPTVIVE